MISQKSLGARLIKFAFRNLTSVILILMIIISMTLTVLIADVEISKLSAHHERGLAAALGTSAVFVMEFAAIVFSVATALFRASGKETWGWIMLTFSVAITGVNAVIINEIYHSTMITNLMIHTLNLSRLAIGEMLGFILITNNFTFDDFKFPNPRNR